MDNKQILIVCDDEDVKNLIDTTLALDGHSLLSAKDAVKAVEILHNQKPDLVIADIDLPRMEGLNLAKQIRLDKHLHKLPILMLTSSRTHPQDRLAGLKLGADEYMLKPIIPQELSVTVSRMLINQDEHRSNSPLTDLPGNYSLETELHKLLSKKAHFAVCYFDIDNFKPYNDHYGHEHGDIVITYLAKLVKISVDKLGNPSDLLVHLGGDDFVLLSTPNKISSICDNIVKEFSSRALEYYTENDRNQGYITVLNRKGERVKYGLMSISIAVASSENQHIKHYAQIIDVLMELKRFAKSHTGSLWVQDRRRQHR